MKSLLVILFFTAALCANGQATNPVQKIGHADGEYIFRQLPEYKKIETDLKAFETQLQTQLKTMGQELETKYKSYTEMPANTPDAIKKGKETELTNLQDNLQKFKQDAEASMQKKQNDLITPVFAKIGKAIEEVASANGYSYIINPQMMGGGDILLFADEKYDISDLVLKKLGVEVPKPPAK